jgi:hypothetical protein
MGGGEVLKERAVGEGIQSLAAGGGSRVAKNPGPVLAESDELLRGVRSVILVLETVMVKEGTGLAKEFKLGDCRLVLSASE